MLQAQLNLPAEADQAAANHHRMEGAKLFLFLLFTIGDQPKDTDTKKEEGLKYG